MCIRDRGVITIFDIFQCDTDISTATGNTCGYRFGIRYTRIYQIVDIFRIITDVFIAGDVYKRQTSYSV